MPPARMIAASPALLAVLVAVAPTRATDYYVDSDLGDDSAEGSLEHPWRTLQNLSEVRDGCAVRFKAGGQWETDQAIGAGTGMTYTAYGDGPLPLIRSTGANVLSAYGSNVVVSRLRLEGSSNAAVIFMGDGHRLEECEIADAGMGVMVLGSGSVITRNTIRDLNMVTNDGDHQDYGAECVMISGSDTEVSYNRLVNCQAESEYFGEDGGAIEVIAEDNAEVSNIRVHHNYSENSVGFFQAASYSSAFVRDAVFAYNVVVDSRWVAQLWTGAIEFEGIRFENNTVVWPAGATNPTLVKLFLGWSQMGTTGSVEPGAVLLQNNMFVSFDGPPKLLGTGIARDHNLYSHPSDDSPFELLSTEQLVDDPGFVDLVGGDYHLVEGSPAIDAGVELGYTHDFDDMVVPAGNAPDLGAYEYGSSTADGAPYIPADNPTGAEPRQAASERGCAVASRRSGTASWLLLALTSGIFAFRRRRTAR